MRLVKSPEVCLTDFSSLQNVHKRARTFQTIESGAFLIDMSKIWSVLADRGRAVVQKCSRALRENFHE